MNREVLVRFCERVGLRCPARLTYIEGRLRTRQYEAKDGSGTRYRTEIVALQLRVLGTRVNSTAPNTETSDDIPF
jgi:single-stranded DNA-binding protein